MQVSQMISCCQSDEHQMTILHLAFATQRAKTVA